MDTKTAVTDQRSNPNPNSSSITGIVKQVLSGDTLIIRGKAVNGPPLETTITLSNIICGRVSRKPTVANPNGFPDDPFGWEAREFLRSMVVGKEVHCIIEHELQSGKKYGRVYEVKNASCQNLALALVSEGLAEVRKLNSTEKIEGFDQLLEAQNLAKINQKGKWSDNQATRNIIWSVENPREFFEKYKHQPLEAIVEQVRDGTTLQMILLPQTLQETPQTYVYITLSLSGIKAPSIRYEEGKMVSEPLAPDAQFFVETRLLQRHVIVRLESVLNQNFIGTVLHPNGNIAQILLREGLARCIEWNLSILSIPGAADLYKAAEKSAKEKSLRLWKDHQVTQNGESSQVSRVNKIAPGTKLTGTVIEVGNGDNVTVKCTDGVERKFFISSIRSPKPVAKNGVQSTRFRVYDVPYMYEAREALRKFLGCSVTITVDYIQPKTSPTMLDRTCATIVSADTNLAVFLVSTGYATVIRYRNVNDPRSASYVELLAAEETAISKGVGMHSKQDPPIHRIVDLSGNAAKSRQFLVFLQRSESLDGVVEFIFGASRLRVCIPRETCLITLLLSGIQCPRKGRVLPNGTTEPDMPFSSEALSYVREKCMQRNVEVKIDTMDKAGNFVGWIFLTEESNVDKMSTNTTKAGGKKKKKNESNALVKQKLNLSVLLVSQGLATVHRIPAIEKSPYYQDLIKAEDQAKSDKCGLWSSDVFIKEWKAKMNDACDDDDFPVNGENPSAEHLGSLAYLDDFSNLSVNGTQPKAQETKVSWQPVQITGISKPATKSEGLRFFAQHLSNAATIIHISQVLNNQLLPQYPPNYQFKKGELCAACFSVDNCWYRVRIVKCTPKLVVVQFIDFGNEETIDSGEFASRLSPLPGPLLTIQPQATEYRLAFIQLPPYQSDRDIVEQVFTDHVSSKEVRMAVQYDSISCANEQLKPVPAVSILLPIMESNTSSDAGPESDIGIILLSEGLAIVEPMKPQLLARKDVLQRYLNAQAQAKKERKNIWRYGDFRVDTDQL